MSKKKGNRRSVAHKNASRVWLFYCRNNTRVYNSIYGRKITITRTIQTDVTSLTSAGTSILTHISGTRCQINSKGWRLNISQSKDPFRAQYLVTCMRRRECNSWPNQENSNSSSRMWYLDPYVFGCHHVLTSSQFAEDLSESTFVFATA